MPAATRRRFLQQSVWGLGAAGVAAAGRPRGVLSAAESPSPFRFAICNETFGDWPQDKIFRFVAACGYGAVELAPYTINPDVTKITGDQRSQLRRQAEEAGIAIVALHWLLSKTTGFHLTSPDAAVRRRTAEYLGELARFCRDLGGQVIVFGSPKQRNLLPGVTRDQGLQHATEVLKQVQPVLADCGVTLALEPLSPRTTNFLTTAAEAVELAERVDSPHCRLLLDCLAMNSQAEPIPELIRRYGQWLVHFHANDPNSRGPGMGQLDFQPIFAALRDIHYRGWVSVEVFDYAPGGETIARESIAYLKKVAAG